ncbi:hypothetical protein F4777DRAFT_580987 [Nemania sp. FL0916]|nr:hypothetical protein F4777DRAFT_580987 [Nemania sp. FL0916]
MESARKIELQAAEDLAYLIANVRRAAAARIDEAFPPVDDNTEDVLRTRIEQHVNEYITQTFTLAAPSLSINGFPVDGASFLSSSNPLSQGQQQEDEEENVVFEPFDARKRARVEALTAEEEDLQRDIAQLKRRVPAAVARTWADAARAGITADEDALDAANRSTLTTTTSNTNTATTTADATTTTTTSAGGGEEDVVGMQVPVPVLAVPPLRRQDDLETAFGGAVRGLGRLKTELPAVAARMERARKAGEYVVTER